jgi:hypothetical protein
VQLVPEGLLLMRGAMLTISPKTRIPLANQVVVGHTGAGSDLHAIPLAPTRTTIEIPLAHFSGAGLGNASGGAGTPPDSGSATDAYTSQLAGILGSGSGAWGGTGHVTDSTTIDIYHTPPGS